jgi:hypothetical protein
MVYRHGSVRGAQRAADLTHLPQTVFYHPDLGWTWTEATAPFLRQALRNHNAVAFVTWLPGDFFVVDSWPDTLDCEPRSWNKFEDGPQDDRVRPDGSPDQCE